jgi:serine/threonine-protein kinase
MGDVYQASDTKLGRSVAIKFLPEAFSHDTDRVARFQREARVLASLNHPNIAAIHGVEEIDTRHFLVMELVAGETLGERIKRGAIPIEEALPIAKEIVEALEEAHEKGIIHRDLKPANIKVTPDGKVKVLDFGLAKAYETQPSLSPSGRPLPAGDASNSPTLMSMAATNAAMILGTAAYMSPEQASGKGGGQEDRPVGLRRGPAGDADGASRV